MSERASAGEIARDKVKDGCPLNCPIASFNLRLSCMTFPVDQQIADALKVKVMGTRDHKRCGQLLGNAMALQCAALAQMIAFSCFSLAPAD